MNVIITFMVGLLIGVNVCLFLWSIGQKREREHRERVQLEIEERAAQFREVCRPTLRLVK
jgi:di/tricarboxylate transporter